MSLIKLSLCVWWRVLRLKRLKAELDVTYTSVRYAACQDYDIGAHSLQQNIKGHRSSSIVSLLGSFYPKEVQWSCGRTRHQQASIATAIVSSSSSSSSRSRLRSWTKASTSGCQMLTVLQWSVSRLDRYGTMVTTRHGTLSPLIHWSLTHFWPVFQNGDSD